MAPKVKASLDHEGLQKILVSEAVYQALECAGAPVLENVKEASPVVTGAYRDDLHLERALTDRAVVRVVSTVGYGLVVEADDAPMAIGLMRSKD